MEYNYRAVNGEGVITKGKIEAKDENDAVSLLRNRGQRPLSIKKTEAKSKEISFSGTKLKLKELVLFCRQSVTMLNAGMSLNRCLDVLVEQNESPRLKTALGGVSQSIQKGETLTGAMEGYKQYFPELLRGTVAAGEITGQLPDVLHKMAVHYEKEQKIRGKIKTAMMYPIILSIVAVVSVSVLLIFVMPKFITIVENAGVEFPALTLFVISLSKFLTRYGLYFFIGIIAAGYLIRRIMAAPEVRLRWDRFKIEKMWLVKKPMTKIVTARFTRTLATLLSSGISVIAAIEAAGHTTQNAYVEHEIKGVVAGVEKGMSMSSEFAKTGIFPPMMLSMIAVGEESGNMEDMLEKTADYYDEEMEVAIQQLVSLIEPLMIVLLAGIIGTIVVAMYLPMFDSFKTLQ